MFRIRYTFANIKIVKERSRLPVFWSDLEGERRLSAVALFYAYESRWFGLGSGRF